MTSPIEAELATHLFLKEQLKLQFPEEEEADLLDTLEGLTSLNERLAYVIRRSHGDECMVEALESHIDQLKERQARIERRVEAARELVAKVMERAGLEKIVAFDATISLSRRAGSVMILDVALIPALYLTTPEPPAPKPDKLAIKATLTSGGTVPGATLTNGSVNLTVRRK